MLEAASRTHGIHSPDASGRGYNKYEENDVEPKAFEGHGLGEGRATLALEGLRLMGSSTEGVFQFPPASKQVSQPSHCFNVVPRQRKRLRLLVEHLGKPSRGKALPAQGHRCKLMGTYCCADMHVCATSVPNITDVGVKLQWISLSLRLLLLGVVESMCVATQHYCSAVPGEAEKMVLAERQRDSNRERARATRRNAPKHPTPHTIPKAWV